MAKLEYTAKKSVWAEITLFRILLCIFIIPIIYLVIRILIAKSESIEFYEDVIIQRSGILSKKEKRSAFYGVIGVSVSQGIKQRIFNYGNVLVDVPGRWDINTYDVIDPNKLKNYLLTKLIKQNPNAQNTTQSIIIN